MKLCPACDSRYSDDTLRYCLQDGAVLESDGSGDYPTVAFGETETADSPARARISVPIERTTTQQSVLSSVEPGKGSKTAITVVATALGMLLLFGAIGLGVWMYSKDRTVATSNNTENPSNTLSKNTRADAEVPVNTKPSPSASKTPVSIETETAPVIDDPQTRREITERLESWKSQSESFDLDAYMGNYAKKVDYYRKAGATTAFVRADKEQAFSRYSSVAFTLSNISVTTHADGRTATAEFDKEWDFNGDGESTGKVRQMMRFAKIDGQWLITAEKDLKLYYKR